MDFKINRVDLAHGDQGIIAKLEFSGNLANDEFSLHAHNFDSSTEVQLVLNNLRGINSLGVRAFINWHKSLSYKEITLIDAPKCFIDQANMVEGFIPARCKLKSFFVPYYSENTDEESNILFEKGINYFKIENQWKFSFPEVLDGDRFPMEMDIQPERYFHFLKHIDG